jgi:RNA polymerase sigma-70 factor (ECF subfamily)
MHRIAAGQDDALSRLYDEASPLVFSIALRILANHADAEEVTLDVFSQVWRHARSWDPARGSVTAWLVLLARSRSLDHARRRKARAPKDPLPEPPPSALPDAQVEHQQLRDRIQTALSQLTAPQREALDLAFFRGLSHAEIAKQLGEPLGTIKSRIRTALLRLKELHTL